MPLTNLARLKIALGVTSDSEDPLLQQLLDEAEAAVARFIGRSLMSASYTEYYDGPCGRTTLILRNAPVTAVSGVWIDAYGGAGQAAGSFSGPVLTSGIDYFSRSLEENERNPGELVRYTGWPEGLGNIKVQYTAGYSLCPADVQGAVHALVARMRADAQNGRTYLTETLGAYSYTMLASGDEGKEISSARAVLVKYRRLVL